MTDESTHNHWRFRLPLVLCAMAIAAHTLAMARHFAWEDLPNGDKRFVVSDFWWFCFSQTLVYAFIFIGIPMMQRYVRSPESSWSHLFDEADK